MDKKQYSAVVADLGGTYIRIAQCHEDGLENLEIYACSEFSGLESVLHHYFRRHALERAVLCLAVAGPVTQDLISMTNLDWSFSRTGLKDRLNLTELLVINDFKAVALAIPGLESEQLLPIGGGTRVEGEPMAVCGPGSGLGVAHLIRHEQQWLALPGEGGHVDFAPQSEVEQAVHDLLRRRYGHVSVERVLSGPGLLAIYQAVCNMKTIPAEQLAPEEISARALAGTCPHCLEALTCFCGALGSFAGNLALTMATFGGVYIAGGMVPDFTGFLANSEFRKRFEEKGRYQEYNRKIPTYVITTPYPGLIGAGAYLQQEAWKG